MAKYTDAMIAKMREVGNFDYNSATALAAEFETATGDETFTLRSLIAKLRALEIDYQPRSPSDRKVSPAKRQKADIVSAIEASVGARIASLSKMTVSDLETLEARVA